MATTITLKNVPDPLYERIRLSAQSNRRSINSEILVRLEAALMPVLHDPAAEVARARAIRDSLGPRKFSARDIDRFKREGRE
jgi:plasmid stability protein